MSPWRARWPGLSTLLIGLAAGCGSTRTDTVGDPAAPTPLRVAAASDLQAVMPRLVAAFARSNPGELSLTFGSSGHLADQIRAGAPFDVFLAANQAFVDNLAAGGDIRPDSVRSYAIGSLVLAVHRESGGAILGLGDLTRPEVKKIALANPAFAPYGLAAKQALERSGLWSSLATKLVQAETVRQALQFVQSGNAEAGLVGRAIAGVPEVRVIEIDPKLHAPILQSLGIVSRTRQSEQAEAFARFMTSEEARRILASFGFKRPGPSPR